jgi:hypothetical protein
VEDDFVISGQLHVRGGTKIMTRYKATIIFDVHEDENRERIMQLYNKAKERAKGVLYWKNMTKDERDELKALSHNPLEKEFHHEINERTANELHQHRTTYEIVHFAKLEDE